MTASKRFVITSNSPMISFDTSRSIDCVDRFCTLPPSSDTLLMRSVPSPDVGTLPPSFWPVPSDFTPGARVAKFIQLRPFTGRSLICTWSMRPVRSDFVGSTIGASPATITVSWTAATPSLRSSRALSPMPRR